MYSNSNSNSIPRRGWNKVSRKRRELAVRRNRMGKNLETLQTREKKMERKTTCCATVLGTLIYFVAALLRNHCLT